MGTAVRKQRTCEVCSANYRPTYGEQRTCGRACGVELQRRNCEAAGKGYAGKPLGRACKRCGKRSAVVTRQNRVCDQCRSATLPPRACDRCGQRFTPLRPNARLCSAECRRRDLIAAVLDRHYGYVRTGMNEASLIAYLAKRDHGRCGICRKPVRAKYGERGPSIDHIVPRSKGGGDELANLQFAHLVCNRRKNNRGGGEQMLLVG